MKQSNALANPTLCTVVKLTIYTGLLLLGIQFAKAQSIVKASIPNNQGNRLQVTFSEAITVSDANGFRLRGGVARIKDLISNSGKTLTFSLTDFVQPDDVFTMLHWPELSDAKSAKGKLGKILDHSVDNQASSYEGTGSVYYISSTGKDTNPGTRTQPFKTALKAQEKATPGDYILFKRGDVFKHLIINNSGIKDKRIVFSYYGDKSKPLPVIDASTETKNADIAIQITNKDFIHINGLYLKHVDGGVYVFESSRDLMISNCKIEGTLKAGRAGIRLVRKRNKEQNYPNPIFINNEVFNTGEGIALNGFPYDEGPGKEYRVQGGLIENNIIRNLKNTKTADGITTNRADFKNIIIRKNDISGWSDDGIDLFAASNVIIEYNLIHDPLTNATHGSGIKAGGETRKTTNGDIVIGHTGGNNIVRYNLVKDITGTLTGDKFNGIITNGGASGKIYGNLISNVIGHGMKVSGKAKDWAIVHNTLTKINKDGLQFYVDPMFKGNVTVANNIFIANQKDLSFAKVFEVTIDGGFNAISDATLPKNNNYTGVSDISSIPNGIFKSYSKNDFKLKESAALINKSLLSFDFYLKDIQGNPIVGKPDLGAYEHVTEGDTSNPNPTTIRIAGDSTTKNFDPFTGWGDELQSFFKPEIKVVNYADPGESTKSYVARGFWKKLIGDLKKGDYVIIQFGHNDSKVNDPEKYASTGNKPDYQGDYKANLKQMAQDVLDKGATPIINSPVERAIWKNNVLIDSHGAYIPAAQKAAQEKNSAYLDMWGQSRVWMKKAGESNMSAFFPKYKSTSPGNSNNTSDRTHTNKTGARKNAEAFTTLLRNSSSTLKQFLKDGTPPPTSDALWLEAECADYVGDYWEVVRKSDGSRGQFLRARSRGFFREAPPTNADGYYITYNFEINESANYHLFTRNKAFNGDDDSFWIKIDDQKWVNHQVISEEKFVWESVGTTPADITPYELSKGTHTLTISYREPNARLDKIKISKSTILPTGFGAIASSCPVNENQNTWLEAECMDYSNTWEKVISDTAAAGAYLRTTQTGGADQPNPSRSKAVLFPFTIFPDTEVKTYKIYLRHWATGISDDSFFYQIDDQPWKQWNLKRNPGGFIWQILPEDVTSVGDHVLRIANREKNARLDKVYITSANDKPRDKGVILNRCNEKRAIHNGLTESAVKVFPNPIKDSFTIRFAENLRQADNYYLVNAYGQQVLMIDLSKNNSEVTVPIKGLRSGIYFLKSEKGLLPVKKIAIP